jgi:hypothetical protein
MSRASSHAGAEAQVDAVKRCMTGCAAPHSTQEDAMKIARVCPAVALAASSPFFVPSLQAQQTDVIDIGTLGLGSSFLSAITNRDPSSCPPSPARRSVQPLT